MTKELQAFRPDQFRLPHLQAIGVEIELREPQDAEVEEVREFLLRNV